MSRRWHILRDGESWTLARRVPVRWDVWAETLIAFCHPTRLLHQVRQDLWRALRRLRGFVPVVRVTPEEGAWLLRAGGAAPQAVAGVWSGRIDAVLTSPRNRVRWVRHAGSWSGQA